MTASREDLLSQLRELAGCSTLTATDLRELRWQTKQRVLLGLLAELPEGKDAVMACAQLQTERDRARQLDRAAKALPEASRRAEDHLRQAFFSEMGKVLASLGAAPALRAPKKLRGDAGICLRAIGFLAARVSSRHCRRRASSPMVLTAAALPSSSSTTFNNTNRNNRSLDVSVVTNDDNYDGDSRSAGKPSSLPLRTAGVRTAQTHRLSRRRPRGSLLAGIGSLGVDDDASAAVASAAAAAAAAAAATTPSWFAGEVEAAEGSEVAAAGDGPKSNREPATPPSLPIGSLDLEPPSPPLLFGDEGVMRADDEGHHILSGVSTTRVERPERTVSEAAAAPGGVETGVPSGAGAPTTTPPRPPLASTTARPGSRSTVTQSTPVWKQQRRAPSLARTAVASRRSGVGENSGKARNGEGDSLTFRQMGGRGGGEPHRRPNSSHRGLGGIDGRYAQGGGKSEGGASPDGRYTGGAHDALGMEMSIVGEISSGLKGSGGVGMAGRAQRRSGDDAAMNAAALAAAEADVQAIMTENVRLRQRLEELQEIVDGQPPFGGVAGGAAPRAAARGLGGRGGRKGGGVSATTASTAAVGVTSGPGAAASEAILRGQVAQLKRQVRLQWCAVDASSAVTQEVKAVLGQLESTLLEVSSLGHPGARSPPPPSSGSGSRRGDRENLKAADRSTETAKAPTCAAVAAAAASGGIYGEASLPAWLQLLDRVKALSRQLQCAERAAQKAADGRIHVTHDSGKFLKPHVRGLRRPRDLRLRALDPDHFTCPPPAHGEAHQRRPGAAPAEGHTSVLSPVLGEEDEGSGPMLSTRSSTLAMSPLASSSSPRQAVTAAAAAAAARAAGWVSGNGSAATRAAAAAAAGADAAASATVAAALVENAVPELADLYHLDAASLADFGEAAAAATRALGALLDGIASSGGGGGGGGGGRRGSGCFGRGDGHDDHGSTCARGGYSRLFVGRCLPPTGVASLLLGEDGVGDGSNADGDAEAVAEAIADVRDSFAGLVVGAAALGVVIPCAPEGAGAASHDSSSPSLRLLRGVKAAGGSDGARRLETLARRLSTERAALEAVAAAGVAEAREWRQAVREQASAVLSLGQGLRSAWKTHTRQASSLSRTLAAILAASRKLQSSPESAPISRGAAGPLAAALLQTLALLEPELEDAAARVAAHARSAEEAVSRLWKDFEEACFGCGITSTGEGGGAAAAAAETGASHNFSAYAETPSEREVGEARAREGGCGGGGGRGVVPRRARDEAGRIGGADRGGGRRRRVGGGLLAKARGPSSSSSSLIGANTRTAEGVKRDDEILADVDVDVDVDAAADEDAWRDLPRDQLRRDDKDCCSEILLSVAEQDGGGGGRPPWVD